MIETTICNSRIDRQGFYILFNAVPTCLENVTRSKNPFRPMRAPARTRRVIYQPDSFVSNTVKDLKDYMFSSFSGYGALKKKSAHRLWSPISNAGKEAIEKADRDRGL